MGTKLNPGKYDCLSKLEDDEPNFLLMGRDRHAPTLVWLWAALRELDDEDPAKVEEARKCVAEMVLWQASHGRKAVGLAHATLAGVMDLVRAANFGNANKERNEATNVDALRKFMTEAQFEVK